MIVMVRVIMRVMILKLNKRWLIIILRTRNIIVN